MNTRIVFIGDEVSAAGYRIAGLRVRVPEVGAETAILLEELARASFVLVSRGVAGCVEPAALKRAMAAVTPLCWIVPTRAEAAASDIAARVRLQLGVAQT